MADESTDASVNLWGRQVAAVSWREDDGFATFQYDPEFAESGIELSPLVMPLSPDPYSVPCPPEKHIQRAAWVVGGCPARQIRRQAHQYLAGDTGADT